MLELLKGSDDPAGDQAILLKADRRATDGHAKNFSIFLRPGGSFQSPSR